MGSDTLALLCLLMVAAPVAIVVAFRLIDGARVHRLRVMGRTTIGHVTALGNDQTDGMVSPTYWADVYCDGDEPFTAHVTVSSDQYRVLHLGSRLDVTYRPGRPRSARHLG